MFLPPSCNRTQNLIGNALKYRSEEPPGIHLSAKQTGAEWRVCVEDNGLGIDARFHEHIFTVFRRLHGREYPGTGIGLATCKRIVERHGGRIWVESEPGKGSKFYFTARMAVDKLASYEKSLLFVGRASNASLPGDTVSLEPEV
jgi:signal transduction histidine kinase